MIKKKDLPNVKLSLSLDRGFFDLIKKRSQQDYVKVSTWVKQFLKRNLLENNNEIKNNNNGRI